MNFLDYSKQYHNFDIFLVLLDDAGLTDQDIMDKFVVSKQRIYDARKRLEPVIKGLENIDGKVNKSDPNINLIIETFKDSFGTTTSSQYDRFAAKRLHIKYTAESTASLIKALANLADLSYYPTVNSVSQFEKKLPQVVKFVKDNSQSGVIEL